MTTTRTALHHYQGLNYVFATDGGGEATAVLHWSSEADAARFHDSGSAGQLLDAVAPHVEGPPEWRSYGRAVVGKPLIELENERLVRRANHAFSTKDLEGVLNCYADDAIQYEPFIAKPIVGQQELKKYFEGSFRYFPDETIRIDQLISTGDWVVGKWRCQGTHSGDFLGMPATGRRFDVPEATIYEIRAGKIQNLWVLVDSGTIAKQFGYGWAAEQGA